MLLFLDERTVEFSSFLYQNENHLILTMNRTWFVTLSHLIFWLLGDRIYFRLKQLKIFFWRRGPSSLIDPSISIFFNSPTFCCTIINVFPLLVTVPHFKTRLKQAFGYRIEQGIEYQRIFQLHINNAIGFNVKVPRPQCRSVPHPQCRSVPHPPHCRTVPQMYLYLPDSQVLFPSPRASGAS